jgi:ABC-type bacteriocin/lantibiotic exporter with double-glycine peptidase domain
MDRTIRLAACLFFAATICPAGESGVWLDVPFVAQRKNACGAASLAMVIQYWQMQHGEQASASAEEIESVLYSPEASGIYASDMERYLQGRGFRTFSFPGNWMDLQQHLEKGRPLIIALKPDRGPLHYVVVAGVDSNEDVVLKNDPAERKLLKQDRRSFEKQWAAAGNWTLLAVPRESASSSQ